MRLQRIVSCTFLAFPDTALSDTIIDTSPPERMVHICMMPVRCPPGHRVDNYGRRGLGISDRVTLWGERACGICTIGGQGEVAEEGIILERGMGLKGARESKRSDSVDWIQ